MMSGSERANSLLELPGLSLVFIIAAPFVGSFLGLLAIRLPAGRPVAFGRSECDQCAHRLGPFDLVPLLSYLRLRARCRYCGGAIDRIQPVAEFGALLVALWAAAITTGWVFAATCVFGWLLLTLALTDWRTL